jgi:hypothetical protein
MPRARERAYGGLAATFRIGMPEAAFPQMQRRGKPKLNGAIERSAHKVMAKQALISFIHLKYVPSAQHP